MNFEDQLRQALRRQDPGEAFTRAVLQRTARKPAWPRWLGAAACLLAVCGGALTVELQRRERLEAEFAQRQVAYALAVTGSKLHFVQTKLIK